MEIIEKICYLILMAIDLRATIGVMEDGNIFCSILGWANAAFFFALIFGPPIVNFFKEICAKDDDNTSMRSSGMTHSEFEKWLNDTCADAPNRTIKYSGCSGTRDGDWLNYKFVFKRDEWVYGYNGEVKVTFLDLPPKGLPLKHGQDTWYSKKLRSSELLKENFFSLFKDDLVSKLSYAEADSYDWFRKIGPARCKDRFLSASEKQKICDDAEHFHQEVVEDLEYLNAQFSNLCEFLFGSCDEQKS